MADPTYVTVAGFKTSFGIAHSEDDTYIGDLLIEQEEDVQKKLGYTFGQEIDREDEWIAAIERMIIPPKVPIISVDTLKVSDISIGSDYYDISKDLFYLWLDSSYAFGREMVEVYLKYTCGYTASTIPKTLQRLIYLLAGNIYVYSHTTVSTKEENKLGIYANPKEINDFIRNTILEYRLDKRTSSGKL